VVQLMLQQAMVQRNNFLAIATINQWQQLQEIPWFVQPRATAITAAKLENCFIATINWGICSSNSNLHQQ